MRSHPKKRQVVQPDAAPRGDSSYISLECEDSSRVRSRPYIILTSPLHDNNLDNLSNSPNFVPTRNPTGRDFVKNIKREGWKI